MLISVFLKILSEQTNGELLRNLDFCHPKLPIFLERVNTRLHPFANSSLWQKHRLHEVFLYPHIINSCETRKYKFSPVSEFLFWRKHRLHEVFVAGAQLQVFHHFGILRLAQASPSWGIPLEAPQWTNWGPAINRQPDCAGRASRRRC